jgi:hypothetical protein
MVNFFTNKRPVMCFSCPPKLASVSMKDLEGLLKCFSKTAWTQYNSFTRSTDPSQCAISTPNESMPKKHLSHLEKV